MKLMITLLLAAYSIMAFAGEDHKHEGPKVTSEFEAMKALVGTWSGKNKMDGKVMDMTVNYKLTSGGTTLVETMGPGTPHEMVTVYSSNGTTVNATHYCASGNQPQYALKKAKDGVYAFEMIGNEGVPDPKALHMRGVTLTLKNGKLKQDWMNHQNGKNVGVYTFEYTKKM